MNRVGEVDAERTKLIKSLRAAIRLKHSLAADAEINKLVPDIVEQFDKSVQLGKPFKFDITAIFGKV